MGGQSADVSASRVRIDPLKRSTPLIARAAPSAQRPAAVALARPPALALRRQTATVTALDQHVETNTGHIDCI